ncbi:hypothetical protein TIFTF001_003666 [Ficus carica]|uniref:MINDY deubiquitinase domain-containing protein n=1 Tax=Ficus carica TaxID=3494 RepID=A0AA88CVV8_FICCA|nr:hypothetical protein TIFTF001_003666 [Ficus carica]
MAMASSSEEQKHEQPQSPPSPPPPGPAPALKELVHKTKLIQFLGRTTPIVVQNDNGPCPLLAICNILLLRNNLNLSPETTEVSQEKLLSLVAERLIDSNSDFEFTPECAIFDLLDIPLYHGWIVDSEDHETAKAIGSKSYNTLVEELVALDAQNECGYKNASEEDCVDFAAATTATLGVPSPSLSKARSFDDSPHLDFDPQDSRKGDLEEEAELSRALKLSEAEMPSSLGDPPAADVNTELKPVSSDESSDLEKIMPVGPVDTSEKYLFENNNFYKPDLSASDDCNVSRNGSNDVINFESTTKKAVYSSSKANKGNNLAPPNFVESDGHAPGIDLVQKSNVNTPIQVENSVSLSSGRSTASVAEPLEDVTRGSEKIESLPNFTVGVHESADKKNECDSSESSCLLASNADLLSDSSSGRHIEASEALTSSVDGSEPIYEGEECILDSGTAVFEDREPVYEGEVVLANQSDKSTLDSGPKDEITPQAGELIRNFLKNNASQLTFTGLFCLLEGLKERELCVFFRNNHFSTMFKFNGELYLLATDQGYINQPDLVWEKLNEVNGDTLFMTGNFKEFKVENHNSDTWDEHNAMTSTADYIARIDSEAQEGMNPDLQLAIALQQQEFDQQPQRQNTQQQPAISNSRLVTGPPVPRSSGRNSSTLPSSRAEQKSKDKCTVM